MHTKGDAVVCGWLSSASDMIETVRKLEDKLDLLIQFVLLKESLRLTVMSVLRLHGRSVEFDDDLYDMFTDLYGVPEVAGLGFIKLQGFTSIDVSMDDARKLNYEDIVYFKDGVIAVYKAVKTLYMEGDSNEGCVDVSSSRT